jgi:hypothetical protein
MVTYLTRLGKDGVTIDQFKPDFNHARFIRSYNLPLQVVPRSMRTWHISLLAISFRLEVSVRSFLVKKYVWLLGMGFIVISFIVVRKTLQLIPVKVCTI